MSESSGKEDQVKNPSRRSFLNSAGRLAVAGVGVAALGGVAKNEVNKSEKGIVTESGIFFPLYERHEKGIKVESIPHNLDVFLRETGGMGTFSRSPEDSLLATLTFLNKEESLFPSKLLTFLSKEKTEIMLGDVKTPVSSTEVRLNVDENIMIGEGVAGGGIVRS